MKTERHAGLGYGIKRRLVWQRDRLLDSFLTRVDHWTTNKSSRKATSQHERDENVPPTRVAIVGCGFVADFYGRTLTRHPELELIGVMDRDSSRAAKFASLHRIEVYSSLKALLDDARVEVVINLTNPESHFAISKAGLEAGKHVYSEKPLAMTVAEAEELVALAEARKLILSCAPCTILGESAKMLAQALRRNDIGKILVIYAELDDGPIHQMHPQEWTSLNGTPWPWRDEFAIGCTLEHAAYHLTLLVALFGPAESVTAFSSCRIPEKHPDLPAEKIAADFSVACIQFHSGIVARLTCSIVAPSDHSLRIVGEKGVLSIDDCWHLASPVRLFRFTPLRLRAETFPWLRRNGLARAIYRLNGTHLLRTSWRRRLKRHEIDYLLGVSELASALRQNRPCRMSAELAFHVTEIALAIHHAGETGSCVPIRSTVDTVATKTSMPLSV